MNSAFSFSGRFFSMMAGTLAMAIFAVGCNKPTPPSAKPAAAAVPLKANALESDSNAVALYVSTFEELPPQKGKDPFYPNSHRRDPVAPVVASGSPKTPVAATLILRGIAGSVGRRLAVINNEIMAVGESSPVRVPTGHVRVKCLEIGEDYAVVQVEGEAEPKRLTMEQKK